MCLCMIWTMIESVDADLAPAPLFIQPYIIIVSDDDEVMLNVLRCQLT